MNLRSLKLPIFIITVIVIALIFINYTQSDNSLNVDGESFEDRVSSLSQKSYEGLAVGDVVKGSGRGIKEGDRVTVHYIGALKDGTVFDSSRDRDRPLSFTVGEGRVIQGWEMGVLDMKEGGLRMLFIPPELGYGSRSQGPIPPDSTLIFEIELLSIDVEG